MEISRNVLLMKNEHWNQKLNITRAKKGVEVNIYVISDTFVGMDITESYSIVYQEEKQTIAQETIKTKKNESKTKTVTNYMTTNSKQYVDENIRECNHRCVNKDACSHECCKTGVKMPAPKRSQMSKFMEQIQNKNPQPSKKLKIGVGTLWKHQNMNIFDEDMGTTASTSYDSALQKTFQSKEDSLQKQTGTQQNVQSIDKYHCFNILADETRENDKELHQDDIPIESQEIEQQNLYFDVNFKNSTFTEEFLNETGQKVKPEAPGGNVDQESLSTVKSSKQDDKAELDFVRLEIFPEKINELSKFKRKIEKWDDPVAAEKTFNMCLDFLSKEYY